MIRKLKNKFFKGISLLVLFYITNFKKTKAGDSITFVIFSKDRPMQLNALLESLFYFVVGTFDIHVLYSVSDDQYSIAYEKLKSGYSKWPNIKFIKENSFKKDLINDINSIESGRVFFLVDDIIFKNKIDLNDLSSIDSSKYIFSLRHGLHLSYSFVVSKPQEVPKYTTYGKEFIQWDWQNASLDWAYPLSVDGHLFNIEEVKHWVSDLEYKAPNSFEAAMQLYRRIYLSKKGLCFIKSIILNNPCNKVQTEVNNIHGAMHQSELLKLWNENFIIDFQAISGIDNLSVHEEINFTLKKRSDFE